MRARRGQPEPLHPLSFNSKKSLSEQTAYECNLSVRIEAPRKLAHDESSRFNRKSQSRFHVMRKNNLCLPKGKTQDIAFLPDTVCQVGLRAYNVLLRQGPQPLDLRELTLCTGHGACNHLINIIVKGGIETGLRSEAINQLSKCRASLLAIKGWLCKANGQSSPKCLIPQTYFRNRS
jgi:hypothetical protein